MPIIKLALRLSILGHGKAQSCRFLSNQKRRIATHTHSHHASLLSVLPTNIDKSSADYMENAAQMAELVARMQTLHRRIEEGGSVKAKEKHIARGKMLPREYVNSVMPLTG